MSQKGVVQQQGVIQLYMDWLSQPSRAVAIFCDINRIPVDITEVKILKKMVRSEEFKQINPNMKVPAIKEGDFTLYESHAILRYLCNSRGLNDHWYPTNAQQRGKVDQYLDWHHTNIRHGAAYIMNIFVYPHFGLKPKQNTDVFYRQFINSLSIIDQVFLGEGHEYVAQTAQPSLADISCYCEIMQSKLISLDFSKYPNIQAWTQRLESQYPQLLAGHDNYFKFISKNKIKPSL